jgi:hypothetical protein
MVLPQYLRSNTEAPPTPPPSQNLDHSPTGAAFQPAPSVGSRSQGIVHFNVTAHPIAGWTAQQLRRPFRSSRHRKYLFRDRDRIFGAEFSQQVVDLGTEEVLEAPRSLWQRLRGTRHRDDSGGPQLIDAALLEKYATSYTFSLSTGRNPNSHSNQRNSA